jgi:cytochrome P450
MNTCMVLYHNSFQEAFSAGIGTSAVTITWTMTELIRKPQVMRKVQDEIRAVVGSNEMACNHTTCPSSTTSRWW